MRGWGNVGQNVQKSTNPLLLCEQLWHLEFFTGACFYFQYERGGKEQAMKTLHVLYIYISVAMLDSVSAQRWASFCLSSWTRAT